VGLIVDIYEVPNLYRYVPEFNRDGTEKHIDLDGARFHVITYCGGGRRCSVENCEINRFSSPQPSVNEETNE
jgi:hypothetical protein